MSASHPRVRVHEGALIVDLVPAPAAHRISFQGVLDRTDLGDAVGIEILDFRQQLGGASLPPSSDDLPRWSYDEEIDAFYLRLAGAGATVQQSTVGTAILDETNRLISLEIASVR